MSDKSSVGDSPASSNEAGGGKRFAFGDIDCHRLILELPAAVYVCDKQGRILLFNKAAAELWGREPIVGVDSWCGSYRVFNPDGTPLSPDQCPMAIALKEGRPVRDVEIVIERPDGQRRNILPYPTPIR